MLRKRAKVLQNRWSAQVADYAMEALGNVLALKATPVTIALSKLSFNKVYLIGKESFPQANILRGNNASCEKSLVAVYFMSVVNNLYKL